MQSTHFMLLNIEWILIIIDIFAASTILDGFFFPHQESHNALCDRLLNEGYILPLISTKSWSLLDFTRRKMTFHSP